MRAAETSFSFAFHPEFPLGVRRRGAAPAACKTDDGIPARSRRRRHLQRLRELEAAGSRNHLPEIGRTSPNSCGCGDIAFGS